MALKFAHMGLAAANLSHKLPSNDALNGFSRILRKVNSKKIPSGIHIFRSLPQGLIGSMQPKQI
jgi:hypothetical protein